MRVVHTVYGRKFSVSSTMNKNVNVYMMCVCVFVSIVHACMVSYCRCVCMYSMCMVWAAYVHTVYIVLTG